MKPPRRSTRTRAQALQEAGDKQTSIKSSTPVRDEDIDCDSQDNHGDDNKKALRKRRKKSASSKPTANTTNKQRRAGKLRNLPEMPLDILFEILGHLLPYDLLRLSRTTKAFRGILLKRSSAFVWKCALENVPDLPPCPPQLSEPAYVNLAFDTHCHVCGAQGAKTVYWYFFKRVCRSCEKTHFYNIYDFSEILLECTTELSVPQENLRGFTSDYLPLCSGKFMKTDLVDIMLTFAALDGADAKANLKEKKRNENTQRIEFHRAGNSWISNWRLDHAEGLAETRARRRRAILDRMKQDGWEDVVENMKYPESTVFQDHKLVKPNKDLTDRIWKNIKPAMVELFTGFRQSQQERRRVEVRKLRISAFMDAYESYCHTLSYDSVVAPLSSIIAMDSVQALIYDERLEFVPSTADFHAIFTGIPEVTSQWKSQLDRYLYHLVSPSSSTAEGQAESTIQTNKLHLATSLFKCKRCPPGRQSFLSYKQILVHKHGSYYPFSSSDYAVNIATCFALLDIKPVELSDLELIDQSHRSRIRTILEAYNLPEDITTMDELEKLDPLLECRLPPSRCFEKKWNPERSHALAWDAFLTHGCCSPRDVNSTSDFKVLKYEDLLNNKFHVVNLSSGHNISDTAQIFGCKHCYTPKAISFNALKDHLSSCHDITIRSRESMEHYVIRSSLGMKYKTWSMQAVEEPSRPWIFGHPYWDDDEDEDEDDMWHSPPWYHDYDSDLLFDNFYDDSDPGLYDGMLDYDDFYF